MVAPEAASGGALATGGVVLSSGGDSATGGLSSTGGLAMSGGVAATGGADESGASTETGGMAATGGADESGASTETGGMAATGGADETGGTDMPMREPPPCADEDKDVVMLGDSYVDWITHSFPADLRAESSMNWRSYAVGGTSMATGGLGSIPPQLTQALADNPNIKAIVMTGGGNDILVPDLSMFPNAQECTRSMDAPNIPDCQAIVKAATERAKELINDAANAGIKDVIYFFYPKIPGGGITGDIPEYILEYSLPKAKAVCDGAAEYSNGKLHCHFIDMVPVFEGKTGLFADLVSDAGDGIHPNKKGSKVEAAEVWRVMKDTCVGQPSSSGCCTP